MITPDDLRKRLVRHWDSGQVLRDWLQGADPFPIRIPISTPPAARLLREFSARRAAIERLEADSHKGYRIEYVERHLRQLGAQRLPIAVYVDSLEKLLKLIGREQEFAAFTRLASDTLGRYPALRAWLSRRPLDALGAVDASPRMLTVIQWFIEHPRPGLYLRQLDIPGIDTKFIERHRGLLMELLDELLPGEAIDTSLPPAPEHRFTHRYGIRHEQPKLRLRLLDEALRNHYRGLTDLTLPLDDFRKLNPPCATVFVTENKINGLSFPDFSASIVIFGLGYSLDLLYEVAWLKDKRLIYWGDIDTHGFAILVRLRTRYAQTESMLMDEATLRAYAGLAGEEPPDKRTLVASEWLTPGERAALHALLENRYGHRLRLEQERIPFGALHAALECLL